MTPRRAEAIAHGAATIVNAIASGEGAAFGVDLWTRASVELTDEPGSISGEILSDPSESTILIQKTVEQVFTHFKVESQFGAKVKTQSNIPIARGLKSSSAAANAVALATVAVLRQELDDLSLVNLGVDASFDAKVTVTGAFDDACASYFGGVVVSDNLRRQVFSRSFLPDGFSVLFLVPSKKAYTANSDVNRIKTVAPLIKTVFKEAVAGNFWTALSLNGLIYSSALGFDVSVAFDALNAGAVAAGLCGKGPAVTAVASNDRIEQVKTALQAHEGRIIHAQLNREKAKIVT